MLEHPLCTNFAITKLFVDYVMHTVSLLIDPSTTISRVVIRQIHRRNLGTVGHKVRLPRAWTVLDIYASCFITLTPPEYGAPCDTLLSVHLFHSAINL
ncbi:hypothetical protein AVEN_111599-1 [Araneus ventricosus]|uniref:Uncharacterized protein n=1 Tax=Araneus ventricosus TaxID=182803 RepID=A0A4Y2C3Z9_ARAVE|nr:hypothetical protein AVEN_111599-1 [Araneus ventricosus]